MNLNLTDIELVAQEIDFSESGFLKNAYFIGSVDEQNKILSQLSAAIQEITECKVEVVNIEYPYTYETSHHNAQSLVVECERLIRESPAEIIILSVRGFEKFYEFAGLENLPSVEPLLKNSKQHIWDQMMVEKGYFQKDYRKLIDEVKQNSKKVFCLFHINDSKDNMRQLAENSIRYSHFSARRKPLSLGS